MFLYYQVVVVTAKQEAGFLKDKWYVQLEKDRNRMVWDIWPPVATLQPHLSWEYSGHASGTGAMLLAFDKLAICGYIHAYMCIYIYIFMYLFIYFSLFIYIIYCGNI